LIDKSVAILYEYWPQTTE